MQLTAETTLGLLRVVTQHKVDMTPTNLLKLKAHLGPNAKEILNGQYADFVLAMEQLGFDTPQKVDALITYINQSDAKKLINEPDPLTEAVRVVEPLKKAIDFDWDCLPKWGNKYIAMDSEGTWFCFDAVPTAGLKVWNYNSSNYCSIPNGFEPDWVGRWEDSLHYNPKFGDIEPKTYTGYEFEYHLNGEAIIQEELGQEIYNNCSSMGVNLSEVEAEKIEIDVIEMGMLASEDLTAIPFRVSIAYYGDNETIRAAVDRTCENMNPETFKHGLRP